ncbi:MAG: RNA 2',3'-cyclic phosphodiesterase [Candidatus Zixiibacteriota bacterium]
MLRLFIALHFPDGIKRQLGDIIEQARRKADGIKWVEPHNMHLTLKFLGDTPKNMVSPIIGGIESAIAGASACRITVDGFGGFPNLRKPRVIWAGMNGAGPIVKMAGAINSELAGIGIEKDSKRFSPHITLGRVKQPGNYGALADFLQDLNFSSEPLILDSLALVQSTLTPSGPIYENVHKCKLKHT